MSDESKKSENLPIKDFAKKKICDGHLFLKTSIGRRFYLMRPGLFVDEGFVKKHALTQTVFEFEPVTNTEVIERFSTLFKELRYLHFEKDLREKTQEIIGVFRDTFSEEVHFLNFAQACFQEFCVLPPADLARMNESDILLFRKSLYAAAFAVIIGFGNDYYHYNMIRDFYNIAMGLDIGLCDPSYSYFVAEAVNLENLFPGSGREWLENEHATPQEIDVFLKHPLRSYEYFKAASELLSYPELAEIVLYQHEISSGRGFPRGITKTQVSSWEAVVLLASSMVDIRAEYDFEKKVLPFIFEFQSGKLDELPVNRVYRKLCMVLGDIYKQKRSAG